MRVLARRDLERWLGLRGIVRETMAWREEGAVHRLLIREREERPFESGPHRRVALPGEEADLKFPIADRPVLSALVADLMRETGEEEVCAATRPGTYWLNNRGYAAYLARVPDAQRVHRFLRGVGLTDRFRGGFVIRPHEYASHLPMLAAQAFCGGPDVFFAARNAPLLVMACHEFDVHVETRDADLLARVRHLADARSLDLRGTELTT